MSRRELFEQIDRPAMRALEVHRYQFARWKNAKVAPDYCVEFEGHRYSVPFTLVGRRVELRVTPNVVEIFESSHRVCGHPRSFSRRGFSIEPSHMPAHHREYAEWTPERIENWAAQTGPSTKEFISKMMAVNLHPEQAIRACMGVISLSKRYTPERVEAACSRALRFGARGYRNIKTILEKGLDKEEACLQPLLIDASPSSAVERYRRWILNLQVVFFRRFVSLHFEHFYACWKREAELV